MTSQPSPACVLVVDDDPMSRDLLAVLLHAEGYTVHCVESGDAALALLQQPGHAPVLVLADSQMPGISGAQLAIKLRRACPPETLLLAMSASRPPEQAIERFDGFLLKPFTMRQIADALAAHNRPAAAATPPVKREKWTVVRGPAGRSPSNARLVAISASSAAPTVSRGGIKVPPPTQPSTQALSGEAPALDRAIYGRLVASMAGPQLRRMYALCIDDARKRIAAMRHLAAAQHAAEFAREAHAIKGSCGMLGATELHRLAAQLEETSLDPAPIQGARKVNSLDELAAACDRLERILASGD